MDRKQAAYVPIRDLRVCMQQDARVLVQQRHVEIAWTAALPLLLVHGHELTPVTSAILLHHRQRRSQPLPALPALARLPSHGPPQEQGEATPRSFLAWPCYRRLSYYRRRRVPAVRPAPQEMPLVHCKVEEPGESAISRSPPQATDEFWFPPAINADSRPPALPGVNSPEQAREVQGLGGGTPPLHGAGALPSTPEAPGLLGGRAKRRPDCAWGAGCAWYVCRTTLTPP